MILALYEMTMERLTCVLSTMSLIMITPIYMVLSPQLCYIVFYILYKITE